MRIERVSRRFDVPALAWAVVLVYLAMVGLYVWLTGGEGPSLCMFRRLTDRPCPTCGTTRMLLALAAGHPAKAAACNPMMFAAMIAAIGWLALRIGWGRRVVFVTSPFARRLAAVAIVAATLVNWLYLLL